MEKEEVDNRQTNKQNTKTNTHPLITIKAPPKPTELIVISLQEIVDFPPLVTLHREDNQATGVEK